MTHRAPHSPRPRSGPRRDNDAPCIPASHPMDALCSLGSQPTDAPLHPRVPSRGCSPHLHIPPHECLLHPRVPSHSLWPCIPSRRCAIYRAAQSPVPSRAGSPHRHSQSSARAELPGQLLSSEPIDSQDTALAHWGAVGASVQQGRTVPGHPNGDVRGLKKSLHCPRPPKAKGNPLSITLAR